MSVTTRTRLIGAVGLAAAVAISLSACSVNDSTVAGGGKASASTSASAGVPLVGHDAKLAAMVPSSLRSKKEIVFGASENAPYLQQDENGNWNGLVVDLASQLDSLLGVKIVFRTTSFDSTMPSIESGRIDLAGPSGDFIERQKIVDAADMAKSNVTVLVAKSGSFHPTSNLDFCGKTVGIEKGAATQNVMDAVSSDCTKAGKSAATALTYADLTQADLALRSARVVGVVAPTAPNSLAAGASNGDLEVTTVHAMQSLPSATATYGIQSQKGNGMSKALAASFQYLQRKGVYKALFAKWGIPLSAIPSDQLVVNGSTQAQNG